MLLRLPEELFPYIVELLKLDLHEEDLFDPDRIQKRLGSHMTEDCLPLFPLAVVWFVGIRDEWFYQLYSAN